MTSLKFLRFHIGTSSYFSFYLRSLFRAGSASNQIDKKRLVEESDRRWKQFSEGDLDSIRFDDIPWPSKDNVLGILPEHDPSEKKRRFREMTKRWHPDRFQMRFRAKLCSKDKQRILERVQEISKLVNHAKSIL